MTSVQVCICGKEATKLCSGCSSRKYCSQICQREDWKNHKKACRSPKPIENTAIQHMREHINENWKNRISEYLRKAKEYNDTNGPDSLDFISFFVATRPVLPVLPVKPKPKHFTFVFFLLKKFPRIIFMAFSDRDDGIYEHTCSNDFVCSIVYSEQEFPKDIEVKCVMPDVSPKYDFVNWDDGTVYDHNYLEKFYPSEKDSSRTAFQSEGEDDILKSGSCMELTGNDTHLPLRKEK